MKIAVIGGVAAGTSAAARAKRKLPEAEITIFEQDSDISYSGCGLPYYISDLVEKRDEVIVYTPQKFATEKGVQVKTEHRVEKIIPEKKKIIVKDLVTKKKTEKSFDKLLISTGAKPIIPPLSGVNLNNIFTLRNVSSADKIKNFIQQSEPEKAVIVGGGYIGLEMAESFLAQDIEVTVVEMADQLLTNFDSEITEIVAEHLQNKGVNVITGDAVKKFQGSDQVETVITHSGRQLKTDFVLLSMGVEPEVELAEKAGIELGNTGAIKVNSYLETSKEDIYAAGDCVETTHLITGEPTWVPLGSTANKQGRVAGSNLAGIEAEFAGIQGTAITKICKLTVARTGLTIEKAKEAGYEVVTSTIEAPNHAGYYPDYHKLTIKLVVNEKNGRVLGGQVVGKDGVDKRIDVLATAIYNEMKAKELINLDLAYAPPFSVPKDGVMIAGLIAEKKRN